MYENVKKSHLWMHDIFEKHIYGGMMVDLVFSYFECM